MYPKELLNRLYRYLEANTGKVDRFNRLETVREFLRLYEDGLDWTEIEEHLKHGCTCQEASGEEKKKILEYLQKD